MRFRAGLAAVAVPVMTAGCEADPPGDGEATGSPAPPAATEHRIGVRTSGRCWTRPAGPPASSGMVVFGGMLRDMYPGVAGQVRARIAANVLPVARERVRLRASDLGDDTTLVGAAERGFSHLLSHPPGLPVR